MSYKCSSSSSFELVAAGDILGRAPARKCVWESVATASGARYGQAWSGLHGKGAIDVVRVKSASLSVKHSENKTHYVSTSLQARRVAYRRHAASSGPMLCLFISNDAVGLQDPRVSSFCSSSCSLHATTRNSSSSRRSSKNPALIMLPLENLKSASGPWGGG